MLLSILISRANFLKIAGLVVGSLLLGGCDPALETNGGWVKYKNDPVLGGSLGTCFDCFVIKENNTYRMWFSWRPKQSIAYTESTDGINWSNPQIALGPNSASGWEDDINRPTVVKVNNTYHLWYTGQTGDSSKIGYATSKDGLTWNRVSSNPVLSPDKSWEKVAVMCPDVMWDAKTNTFQMWYSGGEQYEPDAIGYATSTDGQNWTKLAANPIFSADANNNWEKSKVTACQVVAYQDWYYMFYIGFEDVNHAQIGLARSKDGITNWQRHPANPIIRSGVDGNSWDHDAVYKPAVIQEDNRWLLWYNGRRESVEQIGLATHDGMDLGFDLPTNTKTS